MLYSRSLYPPHEQASTLQRPEKSRVPIINPFSVIDLRLYMSYYRCRSRRERERHSDARQNTGRCTPAPRFASRRCTDNGVEINFRGFRSPLFLLGLFPLSGTHQTIATTDHQQQSSRATMVSGKKTMYILGSNHQLQCNTKYDGKAGLEDNPWFNKDYGICVRGWWGMWLTFYKGVDIHLWKTNVNLLNGHHHSSHVLYSSNRVMGSLLAIGSSISYSIWLIIQFEQTNMLKTYPCPYSVTVITSTMGAVQALVFGLCTERHWGDWKLGWNVRLLTVAYSGMLASGLMFTFVTRCMQMRGPLFVYAFNPLLLDLVAIAGSLVLNESLHLGSVLGAILIIFGLYAVLWGKGKEVKKVAQLCQIREPSIRTSDGAIDGESEHSSFDVDDSDSKHSSVRSANGELRRVEVVVT
ncbi:putative EamA domain-containing protein [Helianthus annuus]|nr:putative EamA domain-containing protein [Helianthus annuus]KAJ0706343.1 putative EamA domain-containing protein [Helianthus annuus]